MSGKLNAASIFGLNVLIILLFTSGCEDNPVDSEEPPDITAPSGITDLTASNPVNNSVTLSWTAPGDDLDEGVAYRYDIRYFTALITDSSYESASEAVGMQRPDTAGTKENYTVTGLDPFTVYYFAIKTADEMFNWSGLSNPANSRIINNSWSSISSGVDGNVFALEIYNNDLIVLGKFTIAGGISANNIAKWNGQTWNNLGDGIRTDIEHTKPICCTVYNGQLVVGGWFYEAGGITVNSIAGWNGADWLPLGSGFSGGTCPCVLALNVFNGELIAGGYFTTAGIVTAEKIAAWNGISWSPLGDGFIEPWSFVTDIVVFNDQLIAAGELSFSLEVWNWNEWLPFYDIYGMPTAHTIYDGQLVIGSEFGIIAWNGNSWSQLAGFTGNVKALAVYDDQLIVGGHFSVADGIVANNIAAWDGSSWMPLGSGMNDIVNSLAVYNGQLIAAGNFTTAGGIPVNYIAAWKY